jgi:hypothetical protein
LLSGEFVLGGWWGGQPDADAKPEDTPKSPLFGNKGQIVLMTGTDASIAYNAYSKVGTSSVSANVSPGVDYFVSDRLSSAGTYRSSSRTALRWIRTEFRRTLHRRRSTLGFVWAWMYPSVNSFRFGRRREPESEP